MKRLIVIPLVAVAAPVAFALYREISTVPSAWQENERVDVSGPLSYYYVRRPASQYALSMKYAEFDTAGVPVFKLGDESWFHPVYISQFALGAYDHYLATGDVSARDRFLSCADALRRHLRRRGSYQYWEYDFKNTSYPAEVDVPWVSAMAQGQGASVLLRAYLETEDDSYLRAAGDAIEPIFTDVSAGGVSAVKDGAYIYPQEYVTREESDILNGAVYAYFGVYDYFRVTRDARVGSLARVIERSFLENLHRYDAGYWSLYALWPDGLLADAGYHSLHIAQLKVLYRTTGDGRFLKAADRFERYQADVMCRSRYVLERHIAQVMRMQLGDVRRIPGVVWRALREGIT